MLASAILAPGRVTLRAGAKAVHGVGRGVNATLSKGKAGVNATKSAVASANERNRERKDKRIMRKDKRRAQDQDPFSVTATPVETTARMQAGPKEPGLSGGRATPENPDPHEPDACAARSLVHTPTTPPPIACEWMPTC